MSIQPKYDVFLGKIKEIEGILTVNPSHVFADNTARDTYFDSPDPHLNELIKGTTIITVGGNFELWLGDTNPETYSNTNWDSINTVVQGPPGQDGSGTQADWNESDNGNLAYIQNKPVLPNYVVVNTPEDFGTLVNNEYVLSSTGYIIDNNINLDFPLRIPNGSNVTIKTIRFANATINYTGTGAMIRCGEVGDIRIDKLQVNMSTPQQLFDIGGDAVSIPATSFFVCQELNCTGASSLGTIDKINACAIRFCFFNTQQGIIFTDINVLAVLESGWVSSTAGANMITLSGTFTDINIIINQPLLVGVLHFILVENSAVFNRLILSDCNLSNSSGAILFNPTGKNQDDINTSATTNGDFRNSSNALSAFESSGTQVTVATSSSYIKLVSNTILSSVNSIRWTQLSGNEWQYVGNSELNMQFSITFSGRVASGSSVQCRISLFEDSGSGYVQIGPEISRVMDNSVGSISLIVDAIVKNNNKYSIRIFNEGTTRNIVTETLAISSNTF